MMKKTLLLSLLIGMTTVAFGQMQTQKDIALRYLEQMSEEWNLEASDYEDVLISDAYVSKHNSVSHIYLNQTVHGLAVHNASSGINIDKNGKVFYAWNQFVKNAKGKANGLSPEITALDAIEFSANHLKVSDYVAPTLLNHVSENKYSFSSANFTYNEIPVELKYQILEDGSLSLVWDLSLQMKGGADYWSLRVDAKNGKVLDQSNWTVYCTVEGGMFHNHNSTCGAGQIHQHNESFEASTAEVLAGESYRVFALPTEAPIYGPHELVTEPQNAASPTGWHDTNGDGVPDYTTIRGNNVHAFLDTDDNGAPDGNEPDSPTLTFDYSYNSNSEPGDIVDAALVNLFYVNNMMHDLIYTIGFDEAAGNFQFNNYGNGGNGSDHVVARGTVPSIANNASFGTPADGGNGTMQMGIWDSGAGGLMTITEPSQIAQTISSYGTGDFGGTIDMTPILGNAVVAMDGSSNPTQCCAEVINGTSVNGQIALVDRGLCDFSAKALNAQNAGAVAALICNVPGVNGGTGEEVINMTGGDGAAEVTIPVLFLPTSTCNLIRASITADVVVKITLQDQGNMGPSQFDAAFDNGVMGHEFGHGISNRLTNGPSSVNCLQNEEQMGEGWSDFFGLIITVEEGDTGADRRGIGNYVTGEGVNGSGIRRFPYSTDMSINPQTYDDIKTGSVPHGVGEVWAATCWDLYWAFVDVYGWKAWDDPEFTDSGNYKGMLLVMDGMKNQPCNPGYMAGRDAIIGADIANFNGEHECLIWDVFARRGIGYYADGGSTDSATDGTENFESRPQCVAELKIKKTATELITAGDDIEIAINVINHQLETIPGVYVTDEIPAGLTFGAVTSGSVTATVAGNIVTFQLGDMAYDDEIDFTYTMSSSATIQSETIFVEDFESGPNGWQVGSLEGVNEWLLSLDAAKSGQVSWFIDEAATESDQVLVSTPFTVSGTTPVLRFWHRYDTQTTNDAGFIQVSDDGGFTWLLMNDEFIRNGYPGDVVYGTFAIPGLQGFSGSSNGEFIDSYVDVSAYAGQEIQIRFRFGTDEDGIVSPVAGPGWFVDDFELMDLKKYSAEACVYGDDDTQHNCTGLVETVVDSDGSTGIVEGELDQFDYSIFPNPANDQLNISLSSKSYEDALISLITIDGKEVLRASKQIGIESRIIQLNIESIPTGLYVVKIETASGIITDKVMIK